MRRPRTRETDLVNNGKRFTMVAEFDRFPNIREPSESGDDRSGLGWPSSPNGQYGEKECLGFRHPFIQMKRVKRP